jgi:diguanylate cyclase (GGDEF)-like protein
MPTTTLAHAVEAAERVRTAVASTEFDIGAGEALRRTASFGVASTERAAMGPAELIAKADAALYDAKNGGRDRVAEAAD